MVLEVIEKNLHINGQHSAGPVDGMQGVATAFANSGDAREAALVAVMNFRARTVFNSRFAVALDLHKCIAVEFRARQDPHRGVFLRPP
jgi:hypothetical protein